MDQKGAEEFLEEIRPRTVSPIARIFRAIQPRRNASRMDKTSDFSPRVSFLKNKS